MGPATTSPFPVYHGATERRGHFSAARGPRVAGHAPVPARRCWIWTWLERDWTHVVERQPAACPLRRGSRAVARPRFGCVLAVAARAPEESANPKRHGACVHSHYYLSTGRFLDLRMLRAQRPGFDISIDGDLPSQVHVHHHGSTGHTTHAPFRANLLPAVSRKRDRRVASCHPRSHTHSDSGKERLETDSTYSTVLNHTLRVNI